MTDNGHRWSEAEAEALLDEAESLERAGRIEAALGVVDELLSGLKERSQPDLETIASALHDKAAVLLNAGDITSGTSVAEQLVAHFAAETQPSVALVGLVLSVAQGLDHMAWVARCRVDLPG